MSHKHTFTRGDTFTLDVGPFTRGGAAVNITDAKIWFTAKRALADSDAAAVIAKTSDPGEGITKTDAEAGLALVTIDPADTSSLTSETRLVYDVQIREADGRISTADRGLLIVLLDVTQASV